MFLRTNLSYLRKTNGNMTQEKLAEKMGVSRQTVSKWESGEAYPEIPKLMDLCEVFSCKLDDLLRQDMTSRSSVYYPVTICRVEGFRMARYVMITPNPKEDVQAYMAEWAKKSGLVAATDENLRQIGWDFPYVSAEQKKRFSLRGYASAYILPENFEPGCGGPEIVRQEAADYAMMRIRDPFGAAFDRVPQAHRMILEYLSGAGIPKKHQEQILPCFHRICVEDGVCYMELFIHCDGSATEKIHINLL